jgi:HK97 family phage prohead protease
LDLSKLRFLSSDEWRKAAEAGALPELPIYKYFTPTVKAAGDRTFTFTISTETVDRDHDVISLAGWQLDNYKKNPVVLWAHNYRGFPIATCTSIGIQNGALVATARFHDHPEASIAHDLVEDGGLRATSVGFRVLKYAFNEDRRGYDIMEQELLEFSIVPVPANPEAVMSLAKAFGAERVRSWADEFGWEKGLLPRTTSPARSPVQKGIVPSDVSTKKAPEDTPWKRPKLSDFGDKKPSEIKGYFAWASSASPENFSDLKLPHHRASDGAIVWRGVAAAMGALLGARGGVSIPSGDRKKVYSHLAKHYRAFGKDVPDFKEAAYTLDELKAHYRAVGFSQKEALEMAKNARPKSGRVLSAKNEALLKEAVDQHSEAEGHHDKADALHEKAMKSRAKAAECYGKAMDAIKAVLASADGESEGDGDDDPEDPDPDKEDDDEPEDEASYHVTEESLRTSLRGAIEQATAAALRRATGRLD